MRAESVRHENARWAAAGREASSSLIAVLSRLVSLLFRPATPPANRYFFVTVHRLLSCFCSPCCHGRDWWLHGAQGTALLRCFSPTLHLHNTYLHVDKDAKDAARLRAALGDGVGSCPRGSGCDAVTWPATGRRPGPPLGK